MTTPPLPAFHPLAEDTRRPWLSCLLVIAVFFVTGHDLWRAQYALERSVEEFNPSEEEAQSLVRQFERGTVGNAAAYVALGAWGFVLLVVLKRLRHFSLQGMLARLVIFYVVWCLLSLAWADAPAVTLNKAAQFAFLCLGAAALAEWFRDEEVLFLVFVATGAYLALGIGTELALGTLRPWQAGYRFSGTIHPNSQGLNCAFLVLAAFFMALAQPERRRGLVFALLAGLVFLWMTKSRTALGVTLLVLFLFGFLRSGAGFRVFMVTAAGFALTTLVVFQDVLLAPAQRAVQLGRTDVTASGVSQLTGRTDLWSECLYYIGQRPLLGWGYNSFWTYENTYEVAGETDWVSGSAHSIYFDLLLGTGLLGLLSFVVIHLLALGRAARCHHATGSHTFAFFASVLFFALVHGLAESSFLFPSFYTFVLMLVVARLAFMNLPEAVRGVGLESGGQAGMWGAASGEAASS